MTEAQAIRRLIKPALWLAGLTPLAWQVWAFFTGHLEAEPVKGMEHFTGRTALIILFITGAVQTIAEPGRELLNIGFKAKMVLLVIVVAIAMVYENTVKKDPNYWEHSPERRRKAHVLATVSLVLWFGIAAAGRLIAYLDMRQEF